MNEKKCLNFLQCFRILSKKIQIKAIIFQKKDIILLVFVDDMIVHLEKTKEFIENLFESLTHQ